MKGRKRLLALAAAVATGGMLAAEQGTFKLEMGFKMPVAFVHSTFNEKGSSTDLFKMADWAHGEDMKYTMYSDMAGIFIKIVPKFTGQEKTEAYGNGTAGVRTESLNFWEYNAWWYPFGDSGKKLAIYAGQTDDRHWFHNGDERLNIKFGEITILDNSDAEKYTGVYPGLIGYTEKNAGDFDQWGDKVLQWNSDLNENGRMFFGGDSCDIGGPATVRMRWAQNDFWNGPGWYAQGALNMRGYSDSLAWDSSTWGSKSDLVRWDAGVDAELGYAIDGFGAIEAIYKTKSKGNNVFAVYAQPRLMDDRLAATVGLTYVLNRDNKDRTKINDFDAFAADVRVMYQATDALKFMVYANFSMIKPDDDDDHAGNDNMFTYYDHKGKLVAGDAELGGYGVVSAAYNFGNIGIVNVDVGVFMRDLDDNDGADVGENVLKVKASWTKWLPGGAGVSVGPEWTHAINTGDFDGKTNNQTTDDFRLSAYLEVWLNN